jgi:glycosyltransferase involved in cell wall biosynthesis
MPNFYINLTMLGPKPTGIGVYSQCCAECLDRYFHCTFISAFFRSRYNNPVLASPPDIAIGGGRWSALKRQFYRLPGTKEDFVYCPAHFGIPQAQTQIITVHDLIRIRYPSQNYWHYASFRFLLPHNLRTCKAVFTVSETSKTDLCGYYHLPSSQVYVVPNSVDLEIFHPISFPKQDYLLIVGAAYPHKNIEELLIHWPIWKGRYQLKIASVRGHYKQELISLVQKFDLVNEITFLDYVNEGELVELYQHCAALVFPSLWEGFGIPPLEAMASGRPVIASAIPVHQEILGEAAIYITPGVTETWEKAFRTLSIPSSIETYIQAGLELVQKYTWENTCQRLIESLLQVEPALSQFKR